MRHIHMYRLMQNGIRVGECYSAELIQPTVASLLKCGKINSIADVVVHPDDIDAVNKEILSNGIDDALLDKGLTSREQRVIIANGAMLALIGVARLIIHRYDSNDVANNTALDNWVDKAVGFIELDNDATSLLNTLNVSDVVSKIHSYSQTVGDVILDERAKQSNELNK